MKKYLTTLSANMVQSTSVRISMCYYSSTRTQSSKTLETCYLRVGNLVLSISHFQGSSVHLMLRRTLISVLLFLDYLQTPLRSRSRYILRTSLFAFSRIRKRKYMKMSLPTLFNNFAVRFSTKTDLLPGGRLSICFSPNVGIMLLRILIAYCTLIRCYLEPKSSMKK